MFYILLFASLISCPNNPSEIFSSLQKPLPILEITNTDPPSPLKTPPLRSPKTRSKSVDFVQEIAYKYPQTPLLSPRQTSYYSPSKRSSKLKLQQSLFPLARDVSMAKSIWMDAKSLLVSLWAQTVRLPRNSIDFTFSLLKSSDATSEAYEALVNVVRKRL